jgi:hypothetical protein
MLASLLPQTPQFRGRRVVTMHNQRDFIFFRHHRYVFEQGAHVRPAHGGHLAGAEAPPAAAAAGRKGRKEGRKKQAADGAAARQADGPVGARLQELGPRFTLKLQVRRHAQGLHACADAPRPAEPAERAVRPKTGRNGVGQTLARRRRRRVAQKILSVVSKPQRAGLGVSVV